MRQLLLIAVIIALALLGRAWLKRPGKIRVKWIFYALLAAAILLVVFGKLHWIAALATAAAGALPILLKKTFWLLRYLPLLGGFISRAGYGKRDNARFQTAWLRLEINPTLGTLDGEVLQGESKGKRLSSISIPDLERLHATLRGEDMKSAMLLKSYIALRQRRAHGGGTSDGATAYGSDAMTRAEASSILGLKDGATREEIVRAHRGLMQKMHPDRGGSPYLAAKINQAKEMLLKP